MEKFIQGFEKRAEDFSDSLTDIAGDSITPYLLMHTLRGRMRERSTPTSTGEYRSLSEDLINPRTTPNKTSRDWYLREAKRKHRSPAYVRSGL